MRRMTGETNVTTTIMSRQTTATAVHQDVENQYVPTLARRVAAKDAPSMADQENVVPTGKQTLKRAALGDANTHRPDAQSLKAVKVNASDTAAASIKPAALTSGTTATGRVRLTKTTTSSVVVNSMVSGVATALPTTSMASTRGITIKMDPLASYAPAVPTAAPVASKRMPLLTNLSRSRVQDILKEHRQEIVRLGIEDIDAREGVVPEDEPEYAQPSFVYMREIETKYMASTNYMDHQGDLSWRMRSMLIDWIVGVHWRFSMQVETMFLCINIIDRFLSVEIVPRAQMQLVGIVALLIAAKYEEIYVPPIKDLRYLCEDAYNQQEILAMEQRIFARLRFNLGMPAPITFLRRTSKAENEQMDTRIIGKYLIESSILSERFIKYTPSLISAAAMLAARRMRQSGPWDAKMQYYSGYSEQELQPVINDFVAFFNTNDRYKSIYRKYSTAQFYRASQFVEQYLRQHNTI